METNDVFVVGIELMALTSKNPIENIKSDYFIQKLFDNIQKKKSMNLIKYSKRNQRRLKLDFNSYKELFDTFPFVCPRDVGIQPYRLS